MTLQYDISKKEILDKYSQEEIIAYYLKVNGSELAYDKLMFSPFREERTPSFSIIKYPNTIHWKDWGTGKGGDSFTFVQEIYKCSFYEALKHISQDLLSGEHVPIIVKEHKKKEKKLLEYEEQSFSLIDYNFWKSFGISISTLIKYNVVAAKYVWIDKRLVKEYRASSPVYVYKDEKKVYCPFEKKEKKWLHFGTKNTVEGINMLPIFGNKLIISKSLKDTMLLYELGYNAVSFAGENTLPDQETQDNLYKRFNEKIIFYDNDDPGIKAAKKLHYKTGFNRVFIDGAKDPTDYVKKYGFEAGKIKINTILNGTNTTSNNT